MNSSVNPDRPVCNIAARFRETAARLPDKKALVLPDSASYKKNSRYTYTSLTFRELDILSDLYAASLEKSGIERGMRTLFMVRPGRDFFALTFALFKLGAVPVMIDPGMGRARLLECIANVQPAALVGIPLAHLARLLKPTAFASVQHKIVVGMRWFPGCYSLPRPPQNFTKMSAAPAFPIAPTRGDELAAILFTTGSTGPAKGVEYEHAMFWGQCDLIRDTYGVGEKDIDLPTFPLFALFSVTLGMTAVVPDMDPTAPIKADPRKIIAAIHDQGCTFSFGSPALWGKVSAYCVENKVTLPTLKTVLLAGAPVPPIVHERLLRHILPPDAQTHTPYGATESLPVTNMRGSEVLAETAAATQAGRGTCVGLPVRGIRVAIIQLHDEALPTWDEARELPENTVGEICVRGDTVTKAYFNLPAATRLHKMYDPAEAAIWHRTGDLGYRDERGRIWFCGRKGHRVETTAGRLYTVCCEAILLAHPQVVRAALVGVGKRETGEQIPVMIIEPTRLPQSEGEAADFRAELFALVEKVDLYALPVPPKNSPATTTTEAATTNPATEKLSPDSSPEKRVLTHILFHQSLPVDIRHNAKIFREKLSVWATQILVQKERL